MPIAKYICPRCNYCSIQRTDIMRHFNRKKPCINHNQVELNEEIIATVLKDHIYHPPKPPEEPIIKINNINNINNNNYNMLVGIVNQMDTREKLGYYLDRQENKLLDFEDELENRFEYRNDRLIKNKFKAGYFLDQDGIFKLIDDVTRVDDDDLHKLNVVLDKVLKRFKIYRCKEWESYLEEIGAKELVSLIKSYYLDNYELYLIKNLHSDYRLALNRAKLTQHLELYYRFIGMFDLLPQVDSVTDQSILGHKLIEDNNEHLSETYMKMYFNQKQATRKCEREQIRKKVIGIVRNNTTHNINKLNQKILELLKVDETFRKELLKTRELVYE